MARSRRQVMERRTPTWAVFILLLLRTLLVCRLASAGECTEADQDYVEKLEVASKAGPPFQWGEGFKCLACRAESWSRWAGPIAARRFQGCRTSPFRERIADACLPFLDGPQPAPQEWFQPRVFAAELLAYYGISSVAHHDVFLILATDESTRRRLSSTRLMALACLRDSRTVPFLQAAYDSLRDEPGPESRIEVTDILNCLYHLLDPGAIALATHIRELETDAEIRTRADRVINR